MNTHTSPRGWLPKLCAGALAAATLTSAFALKVDMYAIGNWSGGNCAPGSTDTDRGSWPGMAESWYNMMGALGNTKTGHFVDGNMTVQRFCDPTVNANCKDYVWVDWPDAAIVAAHGYDAGNAWGTLMRNAWSGTCNTVMGGSSPNMKVGDNNLKFLNASSCLSLNDNYFNQMRFSMKKPGSTKGLHVMTGFHGVMWINSAFNGNYSNAALDGHISSVAKGWVMNHYKSNQFACAAYDPFNWFGTCQDQCPTAYSTDSTASRALNRLLYERYNNSAAFGSPAGTNYYAWMGYLGCDPVAQDGFNP